MQIRLRPSFPAMRDELLSLLIANMGLDATWELVPRGKLWEASV